MKRKISNLRLLVSAFSFAAAAIFLAVSYDQILPIFDGSSFLLNLFIALVGITSLAFFAMWLTIFIKGHR